MVLACLKRACSFRVNKRERVLEQVVIVVRIYQSVQLRNMLTGNRDLAVFNFNTLCAKLNHVGSDDALNKSIKETTKKSFQSK